MKQSTPKKPARLGAQPARRPAGRMQRAPAPQPRNWKQGAAK
jgi:hypothetical protein